MAGGPTTPALVAAVSQAGGFGFLAGDSLSPEKIAAEVSATRLLTDQPFGVNLFVPRKPDLSLDQPDIARYENQLEPVARHFDLHLAGPSYRQIEGWVGRIAALLAEPVAVVSFTFGCPSIPLVEALHGVGSAVACTVTSRDEADAAAGVGVDALIVQGCDAGGHRGTHSVRSSPNSVPAVELVAELSDRGLPVIAAGGVAGPEDVRRLKQAGASAVQVGTMFLLSREAGTDPTWRCALQQSERQLVRTRAFTGRVAQGLNNEFVNRFDAVAPPVYPQVSELTKPIRTASAAAGDAEFMSLWAGAGWRSCRSVPAGEIVQWLSGIA